MKTDIRSLTGVRGAAAVIIVIYHFGKFRLDPTSSVTVWSVPHGYLAVDMFFMLSGFVIAYVYAEAFLAAAPGTYRTFLIKRFARLYPAYIVISAFYALKIALGLTGEETFARFDWFDAERSSRHLGNNLSAYVLCVLTSFAAILFLSFLSYRLVEVSGRQFAIRLLSPQASTASAGV